MTDMRDELLDRVVSELRTLPPVDEAAVGRIVGAVSRQRAEGSGRPAPRLRAWWSSRVPLAAAAGIAVAAALGGYLVGDMTQRDVAPTVTAAGQPTPESLALASSTLPPAQGAPARSPVPAAVPTQFVLDAPAASRVSLVGNFNGWDAGATPLVRDPSSGIWTATVPLPPGRHVYAFLVDGRAWTLDPRAPAARDPDFGTPSSVVLVGAP